MQGSNYFPVTIVDGFLEYPEKLREYALDLTYQPDETGRWPGMRSNSLNALSPTIFHTLVQKILDLFFSKNQNYQYNAISQFQIVNKDYNTGWIHQDPYILTAILYLSPESTGGTSLYRKSNIQYSDWVYNDNKVASYKNKINDNTSLHLHNQNYEETLSVKGIFNRLLVFDSSIYHGAQDFFGNELSDSRLTLVTFIDGITGDYISPLRRSKSITSGGTIL